MSRRTPKNVADSINEVGQHIDDVLRKNTKERYFESIVLLQSLIENVLRWLIFLKLLWEADRVLSKEERKLMAQFTRDLNFHKAIRSAFVLGLLDLKLMNEIDTIRQDRNDFVHQAWLYEHRENFNLLRGKLEDLVKTTKKLIRAVKKLTNKIGLKEVFTLYP